MKQKRVLVITDSISMPRPGIPYEETWLYLLKKEFPRYDFIDRPARGSTTRRLVTEGGGGLDLLETYRPDTVILQMGITECAPRFFKKPGFEHALLKRLPIKLRERYINRVKRIRTRDPKITDVPPDIFRSHLITYFKRAEEISADVIVILINPPSDLFMEKSPHIRKNVDLYNSIYRKTAELFPSVTVISPLEGVEINSISIDELHINAEGSQIIFKALKPLL